MTFTISPDMKKRFYKRNIQASRAALKKFTALVLTATFASGCVDIAGPVPEPITDDELMASVRITAPAVMIQAGDSLDLSVEAVSMSGRILEIDDSARIRWSSADNDQVTIDSTGRIYARTSSTLPVDIIASYKRGPVTMADTIPVFVTEHKYDFTSIRIEVPDSNRFGAPTFYAYPRVRVDLYKEGDMVLSGANVYLDIPEPLRLTSTPASNGGTEYTVLGEKPLVGRFYIRASGNIYGTVINDSVEWVGTYPSLASLEVYEDAAGVPYVNAEESSRSVAPCGYVAFIVLTSDPIDIIFDDSTAVAECPAETFELGPDLFVTTDIGGRILDAQAFRIKKISAPGIHSWRGRRSDTKEDLPLVRGTIIVMEDE